MINQEIRSNEVRPDIWGVHRTLCDVLEDMRKMNGTRNTAAMAALIEEAQVMGNRMEGALSERKDIIDWSKRWHRARKAMKQLADEMERLEKKVREKQRELQDMEAQNGNSGS